MRASRPDAFDGADFSLTGREQEVFRRLADPRDKEITAAIGLSAHGVTYHLHNPFAKLGASTPAKVVRLARDKGLIPDDS